MHYMSKSRFKAITCTSKVTHAAPLQASSCSGTPASRRVTQLPLRLLDWTFWRCSRFIEDPGQFVLFRSCQFPLRYRLLMCPFLSCVVFTSSCDFSNNSTNFLEHACACFSMAARTHLALLLSNLTQLGWHIIALLWPPSSNRVQASKRIFVARIPVGPERAYAIAAETHNCQVVSRKGGFRHRALVDFVEYAG